MDKSKFRWVSFLLVGLMSAVLLTSCSFDKGTSEDTLAQYMNNHEKVESQLESEIDESFNSADINATMEVEDNTINIIVDMTKLLSSEMTKTDKNIKILEEQFNERFSKLDSNMIDSISKLEKETGISGVSIIVRVMWDEDEIYSYTFSAS
jgi:hypothetical protein